MDMHNVRWPGWQAVRPMGSGAAGEVFEIQHYGPAGIESGALKVIQIPRDPDAIRQQLEQGNSIEDVKLRYRARMEEVFHAYGLMASLRDHPNVLSCEPPMCEAMPDGIGWELCVKSDMATPVSDLYPQGAEQEQVIRLGADVAAALALCQERGLVHEGVKAANVFRSADGSYQLGDFGAAKATGIPCSGNMRHMSPEVYWGMAYDSRSDVYALGILLYTLLNDGCLPLTEPGADEQAINDACARRLSGEQLTAPRYGSEQLQQVVLRACAYEPAKRYGSAMELREDLLALVAVEPPVQVPEEPVVPVQMPEEPAVPVQMPEEPAVPVQMPEEPVVPVQMPEEPVVPVQELEEPTAPVQTLEDPIQSAQVLDGPVLPVQTQSNQYQSVQTQSNQYQSAQMQGNQYQSAQTQGNQYQPVQTQGNQYQPVQTQGNQYQPVQMQGNPYQVVQTQDRGRPEPVAAPVQKKKKGGVLFLVLAVVAALLAISVIFFFVVHIWSDVSCNEVAKCLICGKTGEKAEDHQWEQANCTEAKTCRVCGELSGEALGHSWIAATRETPATCEVCGKTEGTVLLPSIWLVRVISSGWQGGHEKTVESNVITLAFPEDKNFAASQISVTKGDGTAVSEGITSEWIEGTAKLTLAETLETGVYNIQFESADAGAMITICYGYESNVYLLSDENFWGGSTWCSDAHNLYLSVEGDQVTATKIASRATVFDSARDMLGVTAASDGGWMPTAKDPVALECRSYVRDGKEGLVSFSYEGWYLACDEQGAVYMTQELDENCFWVSDR